MARTGELQPHAVSSKILAGAAPQNHSQQNITYALN